MFRLTSKMCSIVVLFGILIAGVPAALAQSSDLTLGTLAVYYGLPSAVNDSAGNVFAAAAEFGAYDIVVFVEGLEEVAHVEHSRTSEIVRILNQQYDTRVFGYIDGPRWGTSWRNSGGQEADWQAHVSMWKQMGVEGIFVDRFGYDWQISRVDQNNMLDVIHASGLQAFVNGWFIDHVFGNEPDGAFPSGNPRSVPSHIRETDLYLLESFSVIEGRYDDCYRGYYDSWIDKAKKALDYRESFGTEMWALATAANSPTSAQVVETQLRYAWYAAAIYGFEGVGWSESYFSASGSATNQLPWRFRPNPNQPAGIGSSYIGDVLHQGDVQSRSTDLGELRLTCSASGIHYGTFIAMPETTATPTPTPRPTLTPVPTQANCDLAPFDLNGDAVIDVDDISMLIRGSVFNQSEYTPTLDFVPDGIIDIEDIMALVSRFGDSCL